MCFEFWFWWCSCRRAGPHAGALFQQLKDQPPGNLSFQTGHADALLSSAKPYAHPKEGCVAVVCDVPEIPQIQAMLQQAPHALYLHHEVYFGNLERTKQKEDAEGRNNKPYVPSYFEVMHSN